MPQIHHLSYWEGQHYWAPADVVVIGGGIVGLQTALSVHDINPKLRICIIEPNDPPAGASTRNAGFACIGSLGELTDDVANIGFEATIALVRRRSEGLRLLRQRIGDNVLRYEHCGNVEWFRTDEEEAFEAASALVPQFNAALPELTQPFNIESGFRQNTGLPACGAIVNRAEGQLDPGALVTNLQAQVAGRGIPTLHRKVHSIQGDSRSGFELDLGADQPFRAWGCVLAVNGYAERLMETAVVPAHNQVIVSAPVAGLRWHMPMHLERGYGYVRRIGDRVLVGGFRNRFPPIQDPAQMSLSEEIGRYLREILHQLLPPGAVASVDYEWAGVLGLGPTRSPAVTGDASGRVLACGLGGMGVALGSLLAKEAAQLLIAQLDVPHA